MSAVPTPPIAGFAKDIATQHIIHPAMNIHVRRIAKNLPPKARITNVRPPSEWLHSPMTGDGTGAQPTQG